MGSNPTRPGIMETIKEKPRADKCEAEYEGQAACSNEAVALTFNGRRSVYVCQDHLDQIKAIRGVKAPFIQIK